VRAPAVDLHTLVENVVATINTIIFSSLLLCPYFSTRRGCPRVVKFFLCTYEGKTRWKMAKQNLGDPFWPPGVRFLGFLKKNLVI
jgi:hypothetical protein